MGKLFLAAMLSGLAALGLAGCGGGGGGSSSDTQLPPVPPNDSQFLLTGSFGEAVFGNHLITGMTLGPNGNIYVSCNNSIDEFTPSGVTVLSVPAHIGSGERTSPTPGGLAVDAAGNIFATDGQSGCIDAYDSAGKFRREFPVDPGAPNQNITSVSLGPDNKIYGSDPADNLIIKYSRGGEFLGHISTPNTPNILLVAKDGSFYGVASTSVEHLSPTGALLKTASSEAWTDSGFLDSDGNLWVGNVERHLVTEYTSSLVSLGQFSPLVNGTAWGVVVGAGGKLYIATQGPSNIEELTPKK